MKYISRAYRKGDEIAVINLYHSITGTRRTQEQYSWEWLNTWDGQGSIWLMLDPSRKISNQVVCQYSLIPTPMHFFGEYVVAGKTENCMSHIDLRGQRVYFPHEKKYFELAKERFNLFFTTTGKGAPGRVRRKLGYMPIGNWREYYYFNNVSSLKKFYWNSYFNKLYKSSPKLFLPLFKVSNTIFSNIMYFSSRSSGESRNYSLSHKFSSSEDVDFSELEKLWCKNKSYFSITIERTKEYLEWRIMSNPYLEYNVQLVYENDNLVAYLIYYLNKANVVVVEDLLIDGMNKNLGLSVLEELRIRSINIKSNGISFSYLEGNVFLKRLFEHSYFLMKKYGFISPAKNKNKELDKHFFAFCSDKHKIPHFSATKNWYVTGLFREGVQ